jgi:hypothetical protein
MTVGTEDNLATDALALIALKGITIGVVLSLVMWGLIGALVWVLLGGVS